MIRLHAASVMSDMATLMIWRNMKHGWCVKPVRIGYISRAVSTIGSKMMMAHTVVLAASDSQTANTVACARRVGLFCCCKVIYCVFMCCNLVRTIIFTAVLCMFIQY